MPVTKNPHTTLAGVGALVGAILVFVICKYFNLPDAVTTMLSGLVGGLFVTFGLVTAGDSATNEATAHAIASQVNSALAALKSDLDAKHNANALAIAVNEAKIAVVVPQPVAPVSPLPAMVPTQSQVGHLVE